MSAQQHDCAELVLRMVDALIAFGCALANRGLLTRQEIADQMAIAVEQQRRAPGDNPSRRLPAESLRNFFAAAVYEGHGAAKLFEIRGGKADAPDDRPA